jgi:hypothetical protein
VITSGVTRLLELTGATLIIIPWARVLVVELLGMIMLARCSRLCRVSD